MRRQKISKKMIIKDLLNVDDEIAEILKNNGLRCAYCANSLFETLEYGAEKHGKDADVIIVDILAYLKGNN